MTIDEYVENGLTNGIERQMTAWIGVAVVRLGRVHVGMQPVDHELRNVQR